jgi:hypothetical protein
MFNEYAGYSLFTVTGYVNKANEYYLQWQCTEPNVILYDSVVKMAAREPRPARL